MEFVYYYNSINSIITPIDNKLLLIIEVIPRAAQLPLKQHSYQKDSCNYDRGNDRRNILRPVFEKNIPKRNSDCQRYWINFI